MCSSDLERDLESGLDYYRARYYDSNVGRFISVDPMGFEAGDTNLYRYVGNSSTNATDPTGQDWLQDRWRETQQWGQKAADFYGGGFSDIGKSTAQEFSNAGAAIGQFFNTQNAVDYYSGLVNRGQQQGGVLGAIEQGAGYLGGTFAAVPVGLSDFAKAHPVFTTKIGGAVRALGGVAEIAGGIATAELGIGVLITGKGIDDFQAGIRHHSLLT